MNSESKRGFLVVFEGIDGAGKTAQSQWLQESLEELPLPVVRTKEPTAGRYGQMLRDSALSGRLSAEEEVEAFMNDRREHVATLIKPALAAVKIVIIDRYYFSTAAYQGCRGLDPQALIAQNEQFAPEPDLLIILDVDPKLGLERIRARGDQANHFEKTATLEKARSIFLNIHKPYKVVIDGLLPREEVRAIVLREVLRRLPKTAPQSRLV